jgi:hypothetical protein
VLVLARVVSVECDLFEFFNGVDLVLFSRHSIPRCSWRWAREDDDPCYVGSGIVDNYRTSDSNMVMLFIM